MLSLGIQVPTGLRPNLDLGVDYTVTRSGVAKPLTAPILEMFKDIQRAVGQAANLFGLPGGIDIDGVIGIVTGQAIKFTIGKLTDDLRGDVAPGVRDGIPADIAKDARNVLGVLQEAISRKQSAPIIATPIRPTVATKPFVLSPVSVTIPRKPAPLVLPTVTPTSAPIITVSSLPDTAIAKRSSTLAFVGLLGAFLLAGTAAAVIVSRQ